METEEGFINFKIGDTISTVQDGETIIGKIQEINNQQCELNIYITANKTKNGLQDHNSQNELFRTNNFRFINFQEIEKKVEIVKLKDFCEKKFQPNVYVSRQFYNQDEQSLQPNVLPECFCKKIVNPDQDIVKCNCGYVYHYYCIDGHYCFDCGQELSESCDVPTQLKCKLNTDSEIITLKKVKQSFNFGYRDVATKQKVVSNLSHDRSAGLKSKKRTHNNLTDENFEKMNKYIEKYKNSYPIVKKLFQRFITGIEKDRYLGRENLYSILIYGILEIKQCGSDNIIKEMSEEKFLGLAKKLSIEIEASTFALYNKNSNLDPSYKMRFRVLLANLKDEKNSELREKILFGQISPKDLGQIDENVRNSNQQLANSDIKKEKEEKEQNLFKARMIDQTQKIDIIKPKGDINIDQNLFDKINNQHRPSMEIENEITQKEENQKGNQIQFNFYQNEKFNEQLIQQTSEKQINKFTERIRHFLPSNIAECIIQESFPSI